MQTFLALTEQRKLESPLVCKARSNIYSKELNIVWGINDKFEDGPWNKVPERFLPSRILDLIFLCLRNLPPYAMRSIGVLCWCPIEEVQKSLKKKAEDMERDFNNSIEQQRWRQHPLYKEKREALEAKCKKKGVEYNGAKHLLVKRLVSVGSRSSPPLLEEYSGDITTIPCTAEEITKLPLCSLKQVLHFHSIPTQGNKDQLVLRVLAVRTGTTHLLFGRELEALEEIIKASKLAIGEQIKQNAIVGKLVYREHTFQRDTMPSLKEKRPRKGASVANQDRKGDSTPVPVEISLRNVTTIFN
ncbi:hypothetical protein OS493_010593 [Desmophyllum pertusum]|uniref:SAP domain-containing protein n=1 Tax=Desmophyllum pertusum TaxID=174260 RepID=A0A9W9ZRK6_9CNID|nr:hypothetical protein OS493_010593 [Desmophyllum pertusum]